MLSGFVWILKYLKFKTLLILSHFLFGWSAGMISIIFVLGLQKIIFVKDAPWAPIIIEDSLTGLQSATASNAHVIAKTGSVPRKKLEKFNYIINHLDEITVDFLEDVLKNTK